MSDDKNIVEVEAGMEEALAGGLLQAIKSDEFAEVLLGISKVFQKSNKDLWKRTRSHLSEIISKGAERFPFELPPDFDVNLLVEYGCGVILCVNSFEFSMQGFAELTAVRLQAEDAEEKFKQDNA